MSRVKFHSYVTYFTTCIVQLTLVITVLKFNALSVGQGIVLTFEVCIRSLNESPTRLRLRAAR